jgi:hypothetical protein
VEDFNLFQVLYHFYEIIHCFVPIQIIFNDSFKLNPFEFEILCDMVNDFIYQKQIEKEIEQWAANR